MFHTPTLSYGLVLYTKNSVQPYIITAIINSVLFNLGSWTLINWTYKLQPNTQQSLYGRRSKYVVLCYL